MSKEQIEPKKEVVRINLNMSKTIRDFYKNYADEIGSTMSAVMVMALKNYMDAQRTLNMNIDFKSMISLMNEQNKG